MTNSEKAAMNHTNGCNCSQAVLLSCCEEYGLDSTLGLKVAGGFGGGICRMGEMCGALTAALMLIGLKNDQNSVEDVDAKNDCYRLSQEFVKRFKEKFGALNCKELIGVDISTEEGFNNAKEKELFKEICEPRYISGAVKIFDDIFNEEKQLSKRR